MIDHFTEMLTRAVGRVADQIGRIGWSDRSSRNRRSDRHHVYHLQSEQYCRESYCRDCREIWTSVLRADLDHDVCGIDLLRNVYTYRFIYCGKENEQ